MSTPEQPAQGLTRKQLREQRMTGATPIVTVDTVDAETETDVEQASAVEPRADEAEAPEAAPDVTEAPPARPSPPVHFARAAEPVFVPEPIADAQVDLGVSPLTRRQAREQERIRTASVPVITPELLAAQAASTAEHATGETGESESDRIEILDVVADTDTADAAEVSDAEVDGRRSDEATGDPVDDLETAVSTEEPQEAPVLAEGFGSRLLAEPEPSPVPLAPSFDELIARNGSSSGSVGMPNALILQSQDGPSLSGPITATGEVLITGSLALEGVGSKGHAPGVTDGKEVDSVLIDGELPAHSSPTPIAASAAISTVKSAGEIIRPPAPERGSRLMLVLAITAGALALALVGVLIVAFVSGSI